MSESPPYIEQQRRPAGNRPLMSAIVMQRKICLFGHFGSPNFGNEITLLAILFHLGRLLPESKVVCACTGPETLVETREVEAVPISRKILKRWKPRTSLTASLRRALIGPPVELWRLLDALRTLRAVDMLVIPGTGLLTDACGLMEWGPYNVFKWCLIARMCGCKVLFVSVGAGPVYSALGKYFVKSALSLAAFRSYRDSASLEYLKRIGFETNGDRVYPDLVFSLPQAMIPDHGTKQGKRRVVGIGLMAYAGKYSVEKPSNAIYLAYLENLVVLVKWLLTREYDIRLLIGDTCDMAVKKDFRSLLKVRAGTYDEERVIDEPALSVEQLLPQIAATDIVVATRFHNILLALVLNKPVISISFHHKCASLMEEMGLSEYCQDINHMNAGRLIEQFQDVEKNAEKLKPVIRQKVEQSRKALDEQYNLIFKSV
jgi:polysaccharide pyruvyl transferase WcaK-like protein